RERLRYGAWQWEHGDRCRGKSVKSKPSPIAAMGDPRADIGAPRRHPHRPQGPRDQRRNSAITSGIAESLSGAMTCTPATPGIAAYSRMTSTQIRRPSAFGSGAASNAAITGSGMMEPKSLLRIHRAERAEAKG